MTTAIAATVANSFPWLTLGGFVLVLALGLLGWKLLWDWGQPHVETESREALFGLLEREKDIAAGLGWPFSRWVTFRLLMFFLGLAFGIYSQIPLMYGVGPLGGFVGSRFLLSGRAASRRLAMERGFLERLRDLRDRMSVSNQSLDTALQEIGRNPGDELVYVMSPLARSGSVVANIVEMGRRSRSPIVENAAGVLIWARSRSLDSLIQAIDEIILPVGQAQLSVQEEALVTLSQQRAVTMAMTGLMLFMFFMTMRVPVFQTYYQSFPTGPIVLGIVIGMFAGLVGILGILVRLDTWTRWDLDRLAEQQEKVGV